MRQSEFDFKEYQFVPGDKAIVRLRNYVHDYSEKHKFFQMDFISHVAILYHMLLDEKIPLETQTIRKSIQQLVSGKRVVEIGCRGGSFLKFLKDHGAEVMGNSVGWRDEPNIPIIPVRMEDVGKSPELRAFKPDIVFSMGLLDHERFRKKRWGKEDEYIRVPYRQLLKGIRYIATPHTVFFIMPSVDTGATYRYEHLLRRRSLTDHARYQEKGWGMKFRGPFFETHRFKVRPRRRGK